MIPVLLLLCECGGGDAGAGNFLAFPIEPKEQLISYHTEGQGEDKVVCVLHHARCQAFKWSHQTVQFAIFWPQIRNESYAYAWPNKKTFMGNLIY